MTSCEEIIRVISEHERDEGRPPPPIKECERIFKSAREWAKDEFDRRYAESDPYDEELIDVIYDFGDELVECRHRSEDWRSWIMFSAGIVLCNQLIHRYYW